MKAGKLKVVVGASRSGKSAYMQEALKEYKSVLVWDVKGEYAEVDFNATRRAALVHYAKQAVPIKISFTAGQLSAFDFFCKVAQSWAKLQCGLGNRCAIVIEETSDVTSPAKAPENYGILLRRYLGYGVDIYAITQRPAESDKTSIGNASQIHICRLTLPDDRKTMARATGVPMEVIESLRADQDEGRFDFVTVDLGRGEYRKGVLTWPGNKATFTPQGEVTKI